LVATPVGGARPLSTAVRINSVQNKYRVMK
jgi:hypothetical protein